MLVLATVIVVVAGIGVVRLGTVSRVELQLLLTPFVMYLFSKCSILGVRVPRGVLLGSLTAVLCGAVVTVGGVWLQDGRLIITPLADGLLGSDAHVTRDQLQRLVPPQDSSLFAVSSRTIKEQEEADKFLQGHPRASGVVWGTRRWTHVSLRSPVPESIGGIVGEDGMREATPRLRTLAGLRVVRGTPLVGVSGVQGDGTHLFIGELAGLWRDFPLTLLRKDADPSFEVRARALGGIRAPWTSAAHLALPAWMVGTYHEVRVLRGVYGGAYESGEMACAKGALLRALMYLRPGDNPVLEAAIRNNLGVLFLIEAEMSVRPKSSRMLGIRYLKQASITLASLPSATSAAQETQSAVRDNLALLGLGKKKHR